MPSSKVLSCSVVTTVLALSSQPAVALPDLYFRLVPVPPQGLESAPYPDGTLINGNTIILPGGVPQRVWLEFRYGGWITTGDGTLRVVSGVSEPASYTSGPGAPLEPPTIPCGGNQAICDEQIGHHPGGSCEQSGQVCRVSFQQPGRTDGFPAGPTISGCGEAWPGLNCGAGVIPYEAPGRPDDYKEHYGGTFVLDVPIDAEGDYTIAFKFDDGASFIQSGDESVHTPTLIPAIISVCDPAICGALKNRFLSFGAAAASNPTGVHFGIRVKFIDVPHFPAFNGQVRWLGPASQIQDIAAGETFNVARLLCSPHVQNWGDVGVVHMFGPEIVPDSTYEIRYGDADCAFVGGESCLSQPLVVRTGRWGDIVAPFYSPLNPYQPNALDISAIVDKFRDLPGAPSRLRTKLYGSVSDPATTVDFRDIGSLVDAYRGMPYNFAGPGSCP